MSVLIKGMEMPKNCLECYCTEHDDEGWYCPFTKIECLSIARQKDCPLVEVPPHGDLIDRTALIKNLDDCFKFATVNAVCAKGYDVLNEPQYINYDFLVEKILGNAQTIIGAEGT